ncbi:MAG: peptidylprolyl isomerase [Bacteroidetes bacterium]|nr:MAG: peptidylprolyl isomerase [Bacteroidota bacterium]
MKKIIVCIFLTLCSLPAFAQVEGEPIDKIIASVDNYIILLSELEQQYYNELFKGYIKEGEASKCKVLESMIIQKMMLAKAEIDSVIVEDKLIQRQLDQRMDYMIRTNGGDAGKLEKLYGKTLNDIKNELRDLIREQMTVQKMQEKITENVTVTPKEVRKFFGTIPKDSLEIPSEVEISQIVKIPEPSKDQKRLTRERLEKMRADIVAGANFAEMAKKHSEDYVSAQDGGSLGWQVRGNLVPEYEAEVFRIKAGELSKVIESQFGFHLILLQEKRGNEHLSSHILFKVAPERQDIERTERYLDSLRTMILRDSIRFERAAKEYSDDKESGSAGGAIMGNDRDTKIPAVPGVLDSYLYFVTDTMKLGSVSLPLEYRMPDGKEARRILLFKSKSQPHNASLKQDYQKIYNYALDEKKGKAIEDWFTKSKDQVLIRIDDRFKGCNILGLK